MASGNNQNFDATEDLRQAGVRLQIIYYLAIAIFGILIGRLWYLQVINSQIFSERAEANRVRILPIPAPRDKPEICAVVLAENAGRGGTFSAPRARAITKIITAALAGLLI